MTAAESLLTPDLISFHVTAYCFLARFFLPLGTLMSLSISQYHDSGCSHVIDGTRHQADFRKLPQVADAILYYGCLFSPQANKATSVEAITSLTATGVFPLADGILRHTASSQA